jgi:hypothetical protein
MLETENHEIENNIKLIIKNFIQEKIDQDRINEIYNKHRNKDSLFKRLDSLIAEPITEPIVNYLLEIYTNVEKSFATKSSFIPTGFVVTNSKSFTLKQLINAHCTGQGLDSNFAENKGLLEIIGFNSESYDKQLNALIEKINSKDKDIDIGKIEQSVEAGSEKNPVCGSITEALQNSTDAIKSFLIAMQKSAKQIQESAKLRKANGQTTDDLTCVEYSLATVPSRTNSSFNNLCLTMKDNIGFSSLKSLMTDFLLPDYSNKKPDLGNVGDMGNGSFKIYQQAQMVSVFTRPIENPHKVYWLTIIPLRNKLTNRVEDLSITIRNVTGQIPSKLFGTSIKIIFLEEEKQKNDLNLIYIKDFLNNNVGATNIALPFDKKIQLFLNTNGKRVLLNKPLNMIFEKKCRTTGKPKFKVYERSNNFLQSFVTTGGVPFRTLNSLGKQLNLLPASMVQELSFGYIVDLDVNTYEPVQSRTQLQMNSENLQDLRETLLDAFYIVGLKKGLTNQNFFEKVFTHFGSHVGSFSQVEITKSECNAFQKMLVAFINNQDSSITINHESFFTFYKPSWAKKSFFEYIEDAYKSLVPLIDSLSKDNIRKIIDWHKKNENDLKTIAIAQDKKTVEELKQRLEKEFNEVKADCAKNIQQIWNKWKTLFDKKADNEFIGMLENNVVKKWIDNKVQGIISKLKSQQMKLPAIADPSKKSDNSLNNYDFNWEAHKKTILTMNNVMKYSLIYFKFYFEKLGIKDKDLEEKLTDASFYYDDRSNIAGSYNPSSKSIRINLAYFSIADYFDMLLKLLQNNIAAVRLDKAFNQLFANSAGTDATITHELEHARRKDDHSGPHSNALDAQGNMANFRACANSYSKKAQEQGLLEDWSKDLNNFLKSELNIDLNLLISSMKSAIGIIRQMEIDNKGLLMSRLGYQNGYYNLPNNSLRLKSKL